MSSSFAELNHYTVVSEKNGTFFCDYTLERYIYLLAQYSKPTENHKFWLKQWLLCFLFSLQWCSFETSRIFIVEVRFCIYMFQDRSLNLHHNFRYFRYLLLSFCLQFIYCQDALHPPVTIRSWQLRSIYTIKQQRFSLKNEILYNILTMRMVFFLNECLCSLLLYA